MGEDCGDGGWRRRGWRGVKGGGGGCGGTAAASEDGGGEATKVTAYVRFVGLEERESVVFGVVGGRHAGRGRSCTGRRGGWILFWRWSVGNLFAEFQRRLQAV